MTQQNEYDWIYLSPHLDDVALSCGGQIFMATARGERVLIVTITAGDPVAPVSEYAASLHTRWEVIDATEARRQEDLAACAILGAEALHWHLPDCIYRVGSDGKPFYLSDADIFGAVAPEEMALVDELAAQIIALPAARQMRHGVMQRRYGPRRPVGHARNRSGQRGPERLRRAVLDRVRAARGERRRQTARPP